MALGAPGLQRIGAIDFVYLRKVWATSTAPGSVSLLAGYPLCYSVTSRGDRDLQTQFYRGNGTFPSERIRQSAATDASFQLSLQGLTMFLVIQLCLGEWFVARDI